MVTAILVKKRNACGKERRRGGGRRVTKYVRKLEATTLWQPKQKPLRRENMKRLLGTLAVCWKLFENSRRLHGYEYYECSEKSKLRCTLLASEPSQSNLCCIFNRMELIKPNGIWNGLHSIFFIDYPIYAQNIFACRYTNASTHTHTHTLPPNWIINFVPFLLFLAKVAHWYV